MKSKLIIIEGLLFFLTLQLSSTIRVNSWNAYTGIPGGSIVVVLNAGQTTSGTRFNTGCSLTGENSFWATQLGIAIIGGNPTNEPAQFIFWLKDMDGWPICSTAQDGLQYTVGAPISNWLADGQMWQGAISAGLSGYPKLAYQITNYDVWAREYAVSWSAWYSF